MKNNLLPFLSPLFKQGISLLLLSLCFSGIGNIALALPEDRKLPLHIDADWSEFQSNSPTEPTGIYRGNVVMVQGNLTIYADEAHFLLEDGELEYIIATGNPVKIKDLPKPDEPWVFGEGKTLRYYPKRAILELETNAQVEQSNDIATANKIIYDLDTRTINAERSPKERVHFTIQMDNRDK